MTTLEVLMKARAEVEKGWCKRTSGDRNGNVCALSAVWRVTGERYVRTYTRPLYDALGSESVVAFNDAPETTKAHVLRLFDEAIAAEAVKASPDPSHVYAVA